MAGKNLSRGELNLLKELGVDHTKVNEARTEQRHNPMTRVPYVMSPAVAKIYDAFRGMMDMYEHRRQVNVYKMDRIKYLVLKFDNDAYRTLID
jgi:hypothetical protein